MTAPWTIGAMPYTCSCGEVVWLAPDEHSHSCGEKRVRGVGDDNPAGAWSAWLLGVGRDSALRTIQAKLAEVYPR